MSSTNSESCSRRPALFALVDCNNFYASCERLFRPDLVGKPVVVLSNNDGCIVARSLEAKALGIRMAEPEFKVRNLLKKHHVAVFSSNYALYGDISQRVMRTLESLCPYVEQYSIDEAFLRLDNALSCNALDLANALRQRVQQWTGITVSVGLAPTRTLAKLANQLAKQHASGIACIPADPHERDAVLDAFPIGDVWGIGKKQAAKCQNRGMTTALHLKNANDDWLKTNLTITGLHTALELRGVSCIGLNKAPIPRKTLVSSRSFGHKVTNQTALMEALSTFTARAAERLRHERLVTSGITVHIRTSPHEQSATYHDESTHFTFAQPTNDTLTLIRAAERGLVLLYKKGLAYAKAGVMLFGLQKQTHLQGNLLTLGQDDADNKAQLNAVLDAINHRYGKRTLHYGAEGPDNAEWHMRQQHCSPRVTTHWDELAGVR